MDNREPLVNELLRKPLWQLTGADYVALHAYAASLKCNENALQKAVIRCNGMRQLAQHVCACESTLYTLKRKGILDDAVISSVGKSTIYDGEKARELAQAYLNERRQLKKNNID